MDDGAETFFVDLWLKVEIYVNCMGNGIEDLCSWPTVAVKITNETGGFSDAEFSEQFQELAGLKLGTCNVGGVEAAALEGLILIATSAGALSASSEA